MPAQAPFQKELFQFLVELKFNNERPWFLKNKPRYEKFMKEPLAAFVAGFLPRLKKVNPAYTGGRSFRIYRDTRFARDKTPYKTHAAAQFMHRAVLGNGVHSPVFYLHLEPGECMAAAGLWMPEPDALKAVRKAIVGRPKDWAPLSKMPLWEGSYARPPKGCDPSHAFIGDLKRRHFMTWVEFKDKELLSPGFPARLEAAFRRMNPLNAFLNRALGLK
jgi:uncharacterized protein (TIGR02453 family)